MLDAGSPQIDPGNSVSVPAVEGNVPVDYDPSMHALIRLLASVAGLVAGLAGSVCLFGLVLVPASALAQQRAGAAGLPMAVMLWLAVTGVGFAGVVGALVGWRLAGRWLGPAASVPAELMCAGCGYNLRDNASGMCPECGQRISDQQQRVIAGHG